MATLDPLPMSLKKDDLLRYLNMALETYAAMAIETDNAYKWLTSDKRHLKSNCKRKPPYDWSDIVEKSKDEAMRRIAASSDSHTAYYWNLATETKDCPNWIAKWFLYHKFRYRDGRNRHPGKREDEKHWRSRCSGKSHHRDRRQGGGKESIEYDDDHRSQKADSVDCDSQGYNSPATGTASSSTSGGYGTEFPAQSAHPAYQYASSTEQTYQQDEQSPRQARTDGSGFWDPVRDSVRDC